MKIDQNGRIAYHSIRLHADKPSTIVQFDFDGKEEFEIPFNQANYDKVFPRRPFEHLNS